MATLGQLVAGVAHEINNPVGFIAGNLTQADQDIQNLLKLIHLYQAEYPNASDKIADFIDEIDLEFLSEDLPKMIASMQEGTERIRNISTSLKTFSRLDSHSLVDFNVHEGIDSTLAILRHRIKANEQRPEIAVMREYGEVPEIKCYPGQLNQVFMNILSNAIDAVDESNHGRSYKEIAANPNLILIRTFVEKSNLVILIKDNGCGMSESIRSQVFDHLFTTKAVGRGTGLGLSISRQIIEEKHGGQLSCNSVLGEGTEFIIELPI